jgi:hypothetical protein
MPRTPKKRDNCDAKEAKSNNYAKKRDSIHLQLLKVYYEILDSLVIPEYEIQGKCVAIAN